MAYVHGRDSNQKLFAELKKSWPGMKWAESVRRFALTERGGRNSVFAAGSESSSLLGAASGTLGSRAINHNDQSKGNEENTLGAA